jgi:hypothetical protein
MGKGSKVPPLSRRAREVEGLTALAGSSSEGSHAESDVAPEDRSDQQAASFEAPASLPRRVRGTGDGPRPPARVARPVLPESFLERVRAAAEAAKRDEDLASSDRPANGAPTSAGPVAGAPSLAAPAAETTPREAPAGEAPPPQPSTGLPQRVRGAGDSPRPPARVARPQLPEALLERVRAAMEANAAAEADAGTGAEAQNHRHESAPIPLPRRDPGNSGGPQPPAKVARPVAGPERVTPRDAVTEPIPVISVGTGSATTDPAPDEVSAPSGNAAPAEPEITKARSRRKAGVAPAQPKAAVAAAEAQAPEAKAAEPKVAVAPPQPRSAPSTHARTTPRVQRAGAGSGKPLKRQARASRSYRMAGVLVAAVVLGGLALGFAVFHHTGGNSAGKNSTRGSDAGRSSAVSAPALTPAAVRRNAAAWVAAQVSSDAMVSCDPVMCQALESRGIAAGQLRALKPGTTNPLGSVVIVATPVLRSQIGSQLSSVYAPGLLARFGSGSQQIQVRAIASQGAAAYMSEAKADLAARRLSGGELAQSSQILVSAVARKQLASGEVDSRLMTVITGLAAHHLVRIVAFADSGPSMAVAPFRSAELGGSDVKKLLVTLRAQQSSLFRVTHTAFLRLRTGQTVLRISFAAPSPFGLLVSGPSTSG